MQFKFLFSLVCAIGLLLAPTAGQAQSESVPLSGVLENYFVVGKSADGTQTSHPTRYLTLHGAFNSHIRYVAGQLNKNGRNLLDENYVAVAQGAQEWRAGRFRSAFGLSDWSECYYTGFVHPPMLRYAALGPGVALSRLDDGVDWSGGTGTLQAQIGLVDIHSSAYQPLPQRPDHFVGRLQTYTGNLILGFSLLAGGQGDSRTRLAGLDWRWSIPHVQMRGEYVFGQAGDMHPRGGYVDFFYHPPVLTRTTFLARAEAVTALHTEAYGSKAAIAEKQYAARYTIGIKQILSPQFTLELNRSFGKNTELVGDAPGWAVQLITFTHF